MNDFKQDIETVGRISVVPQILEVICRSTGMRFAAIARVTEERWVTCQVRDEVDFGLKPGDELPIKTTLCDEVRERQRAIFIDNVAEDETYCNHPVPAMYGIQSYISSPVFLPGGEFFGTLCAIDSKPARVKTPAIEGMIGLFAQLIGIHLDAQRRLEASESSLVDERETARLREEFIAVLGHDLRNPLSATEAGLIMLERSNLPAPQATVVRRMKGSSRRMAELIANLMDFARGRLGGGIEVERREVQVAPMLRHAISEAHAVHPDREVESQLDLARTVNCDPQRLDQLFSNLLSNAFSHGNAESPVRVEAATRDDLFQLKVANVGDPIPGPVRETLFQPFHRGGGQGKLQGLGLGLYIAHEIARAHGGTLSVTSSARETVFTFTLPLSPESGP